MSHTHSTSWEILALYLKDLKAQGRTYQAIQGAKHTARGWITYLQQNTIELHFATHDHAYGYQGFLCSPERKLKRSSIHTYISGAIQFSNWLYQTGWILSSPFETLKHSPAEKKLPTILFSLEDLNQFLDLLAEWDQEMLLTNRKYGFRYQVMAEVQFASGIRVNELVNLKESDLDLVKGLIYIQDGKGGSQRIAFLNSYSIELLRLWLDLRPLISKDIVGENTIFGSGRVLSRPYNKRLSSLAKLVGSNRFSSHQFRHLLAYHLLRSGASIRYIKEILGHKTLTSTEKYIRINSTDTREVLDRFHPRGI